MKKRLVLITDDHSIQPNIIHAIQQTAEWEIVNTYTSVTDAAPAVVRDPAVLIVADVQLHIHSVLEEIRMLRNRNLFSNLLIIHNADNPGNLLAALSLGIQGYALRDAFTSNCLFYLEGAIHGGPVVSVAVADELYEVCQAYQHLFNKQEATAMLLLAKGEKYEAIALALDIAAESAKGVIQGIFTFLEAESSIRI